MFGDTENDVIRRAYKPAKEERSKIKHRTRFVDKEAAKAPDVPLHGQG